MVPARSSAFSDFLAVARSNPGEGVWRLGVRASLKIISPPPIAGAPRDLPAGGEQRQTATHSAFPSLQGGEKQGCGQGTPNLESKKGWRRSWCQVPHACFPQLCE